MPHKKNDFDKFSRCITPAVLANVIKELEAADPDLLDGFEEMREDDQEKIKKAFEEGHSQSSPFASLAWQGQ